VAHRFRSTLSSPLSQNDPTILTVEFNAWRYERERHLVGPLLEGLTNVELWLQPPAHHAVSSGCDERGTIRPCVMIAATYGPAHRMGQPEVVDGLACLS
jgi:hypothetical protein